MSDYYSYNRYSPYGLSSRKSEGRSGTESIGGFFSRRGDVSSYNFITCLQTLQTKTNMTVYEITSFILRDITREGIRPHEIEKINVIAENFMRLKNMIKNMNVIKDKTEIYTSLIKIYFESRNAEGMLAGSIITAENFPINSRVIEAIIEKMNDRNIDTVLAMRLIYNILTENTGLIKYVESRYLKCFSIKLEELLNQPDNNDAYKLANNICDRLLNSPDIYGFLKDNIQKIKASAKAPSTLPTTTRTGNRISSIPYDDRKPFHRPDYSYISSTPYVPRNQRDTPNINSFKRLFR